MANKQLKKGRPSLLLAHREPGDTDEEAYEKALAKLESGPVPEFSGFRLHQRDPRKYATICRMLAENMATAAIARACGVSPSTVTAVSLREGTVVDLEREKLLSLVRSAAKLSVEKLLELIPSLTSSRDAAICAGILIERQQLLAGEPTNISLSKGEQLSHQDFNSILAALPQADARVIVPNSSDQLEDKPEGTVACEAQT
jgi:hypothetical protein